METQSILIVDDDSGVVGYISELLKGEYRIKIATSGAKALKVASNDQPPDLILLDIMMPEMSGYEVCEQLKADSRTRGIPVIFLTGRASADDERKGLELGAVDYITKPISPPVLLARVKTHLRLKEASEFLQRENELLEEKVRVRTQQLVVLQDTTMIAMGSLAETRDNETGNHIRRTQHYIKALAFSLTDNPRFGDVLTPDYIDLLYKSAPLHDIGKVGVPDSILLKPSQLNTAEFEVMKQHTILGRNAIAAAERIIASQEAGDFLALAKAIAYSHQEWWDGSGYPEGLSGDDIPLSARLMAVVDVYDALISRRIYKDAMPHDEAVAIIRNERGTHFDPDIVDAFLAVCDEFKAIARSFSDSATEAQ